MTMKTEKSTTKPPSSSSSMSADDFVYEWQQACSLEVVALAAGMTSRAASLRAAYMRKNGVPLKLFKGRNEPLDVKRLTEIAHKALK